MENTNEEIKSRVSLLANRLREDLPEAIGFILVVFPYEDMSIETTVSMSGSKHDCPAILRHAADKVDEDIKTQIKWNETITVGEKSS